MSRQSEYIVDRLHSHIERLEIKIIGLENENRTLKDECWFGAFFSFVVGTIVGGAVIWWTHP
jgi:hypothetical protein